MKFCWGNIIARKTFCSSNNINVQIFSLSPPLFTMGLEKYLPRILSTSWKVHFCLGKFPSPLETQLSQTWVVSPQSRLVPPFASSSSLPQPPSARHSPTAAHVANPPSWAPPDQRTCTCLSRQARLATADDKREDKSCTLTQGGWNHSIPAGRQPSACFPPDTLPNITPFHCGALEDTWNRRKSETKPWQPGFRLI